VSPESGVSYRLLDGPAEQLMATALFGGEQAAVQETVGGIQSDFLLGAFEGGRLLGATSSDVGPDDAFPRRVEHKRLRVTHLAVNAGAAGRGIGGGLMRLQRMLATQQGLRLVTWDQDPLEGRLSHLAIHKLGAVSRSLKADPEMAPGGWLQVEWWVSSPRVKSRLTGGRPELDLAHALEAGAPKLNAGRLDDDGLLRPTGGESAPDSATALVEVPHDIHGLRARDPELALQWRAHLAHVLSLAFAQGYWLTDYLWLRGECVPRAYCLLIDGERTLV
jgi:predicted GNAT superfamily acetyltransferase